MKRWSSLVRMACCWWWLLLGMVLPSSSGNGSVLVANGKDENVGRTETIITTSSHSNRADRNVAVGFITIPIIPHHVILRRRRRHRQRQLRSSESSSILLPRPIQYPRWLNDQVERRGDQEEEDESLEPEEGEEDDDDELGEDTLEPEDEGDTIEPEDNPEDAPLMRNKAMQLADGDQLDDDTDINKKLPRASQVAALFQGYGTHYADLWVGTPPQRQTVIVDTGSGVTAFPCSDCRQCGVPDYHIDQLFDENASKTYIKLDCGQCLRGSCDANRQFCSLGQSYAEGSSWYALEAQDQCYVGGLHSEPVVNDKQQNIWDPYWAPHNSFDLKFGCQNKITGLFKTQLADGIMGMDKAQASFWKQMHGAGKIDNQAFSLCFSRSPTVSREGTGAGAMTLGGTDHRLHATPMVFTAADPDGGGFYNVKLRKAYLRDGNSGDSAANVNGKKIVLLNVEEEDLNRGHVIVDSGTTDTYFHRSFATPFKEQFRKFTGIAYDNKEKTMTPEEINAYPTILLQIYGDDDRNRKVALEYGSPSVPGLAGELDPEHPYDVILAIPPSHYVEYDEEEDLYASRFYVDESRGSVLGANSMMGHDVLFDIDNQLLGWAESDCDYTRMVEELSHKDLPPIDPALEPNRQGTAESESHDDSRFKPEDPKVVSKTETEQPTEFCTTVRCQVSIAFAFVSMILLVGWRLARGSANDIRSVTPYELTSSELELQVPPSVSRGSSYRDEEDDDVKLAGEFT